MRSHPQSTTPTEQQAIQVAFQAASEDFFSAIINSLKNVRMHLKRIAEEIPRDPRRAEMLEGAIPQSLAHHVQVTAECLAFEGSGELTVLIEQLERDASLTAEDLQHRRHPTVSILNCRISAVLTTS